MLFLLSVTEFETQGPSSFQMTRGGEVPPAGCYGDYLINFIASFGMQEALRKEATTLWLTVIPTSATHGVKYGVTDEVFLLRSEIIAKSLRSANIMLRWMEGFQVHSKIFKVCELIKEEKA